MPWPLKSSNIHSYSLGQPNHNDSDGDSPRCVATSGDQASGVMSVKQGQISSEILSLLITKPRPLAEWRPPSPMKQTTATMADGVPLQIEESFVKGS